MPAVAFCPCPPVLVPEVAAGAAAELDPLRAACDLAVRQLVAVAGRVTVVGAGAVTRVHGSGAAGTLAGFGVDVRAGGPDHPDLPLSLAVGAWLLDRAGAWSPRSYVELGPELARGPDEVPASPIVLGDGAALLVMGDGSTCRDPKAPGGLVAGAEEFDLDVARMLGAGDAAGLAGLDLAEADRLLVGGARAWSLVGGALADAQVDGARLLAHEAPYGVGYLVAWWPE